MPFHWKTIYFALLKRFYLWHFGGGTNVSQYSCEIIVDSLDW